MVETIGGRTWLEEVNHWRYVLESIFYSLLPLILGCHELSSDPFVYASASP
jgi:hypothetical protein